MLMIVMMVMNFLKKKGGLLSYKGIKIGFITPTIVVSIISWFCNMHVVEENGPTCSNWGGMGGGEVIWTISKRTLFLWGGVPLCGEIQR